MPGAGTFERVVNWLVNRISGGTAAILTLVLYPGFGLLLPLALGWATFWLALTNLLGVVMAAVVSLGWFQVQLEAANRRHLLEWTSNLRLLDPSEFEWLVGELFKREGWSVAEVGRSDGPDGNIDLELKRGRERRIVQCKRWTTQIVGVDEIRRFLGTLLREKLPGEDGIFVTLSRFGEQARQEAQDAGLVLIDNRELMSRIERVQRLEPCPECNAPMILDRSLRGWWFRCVTPGCSGKRDLGSDPGRAVEFLIQAAERSLAS
jgi:HJR/Mrr/RecB family endonuclease